MTQTHSKKFHCIYLLHFYPFDTQVGLLLRKPFKRGDFFYFLPFPSQVCRVDLQLQQFALDNVELVPDSIQLLTDTELTQYYIQAWALDYNHPGDVLHRHRHR